MTASIHGSKESRFLAFSILIPLLFLVLGASGCGRQTQIKAISTGACSALTGSSWIPSVPGTGATNHTSGTTISSTVSTTTGSVVGFAQAAPASKEVTLTIDMTQDLGVGGSLSLSARITNASTGVNVYPLLVYLSDGAGHEFINLTRAGTNGDCAASGYFAVIGGKATENPNCTISWPSAYFDRTHWQQHWLQAAIGAPSVDTFPTCNWPEGSEPSSTDSACAFDRSFFQSGKLASGTTYTAKYILLAANSPSLTGKSATIELTAIQKKATTLGGAVDLNVILVGNKNIAASRSAHGQLNLNTLFSKISDLYSASGIKLGQINVYEWTCELGGDAYANLETTDIYSMFRDAGSKLSASSGGLNLFLIESFTDEAAVLGISGAIGGTEQRSGPGA